jgi:hypothetical protein
MFLLQGRAGADHTTLLLNCYTKLKDVAKLDAFLRGSGATEGASSLPFDVETAVKVSAYTSSPASAPTPKKITTRYPLCVLHYRRSYLISLIVSLSLSLILYLTLHCRQHQRHISVCCIHASALA